MVALNYREINWKPEGVVNVEHFLNEYTWDGIRYPSKIEHLKNFESNFLTIALNVLYRKEMEMCLAHISEYKSTREKQKILLKTNNSLTVNKTLCIIGRSNLKT